MIEVAAGTQNKAKLIAVRLGIHEVLLEKVHVTGWHVESGVSNQPMSIEEMIIGARNRAELAQAKVPGCEYAVGLEGGIQITSAGWLDTGIVWLIDNKRGQFGIGQTVGHEIGSAVQQHMEAGDEMADAVSKVFGTDTLHDRDCSGPISNGILGVEEFYINGVKAALASVAAKRHE